MKDIHPLSRSNPILFEKTNSGKNRRCFCACLQVFADIKHMPPNVEDLPRPPRSFFVPAERRMTPFTLTVYHSNVLPVLRLSDLFCFSYLINPYVRFNRSMR